MTYQGVAESHADGRIYGHTKVTLGPLHMQGEVSGQTSGSSRTEEQEEEPAGEEGTLHVGAAEPKTVAAREIIKTKAQINQQRRKSGFTVTAQTCSVTQCRDSVASPPAC